MKMIYFLKPVGAIGPIKIGCSLWPENRLVVISSWSPIPLEIIATAPGDHKLEKFIHRKFKAQFSHKEWFFVSDELLACIAKVKAGSTVAEAFGAQRKERNRPPQPGYSNHRYVPKVAA